jgi:SAM-dependent methyltransferase
MPVGLYAVTIFLSAFLLFQVQAIIGKCILPWFGGGAAVWTACMLFFQTALLAGYAYAHVVRTRLSDRGQAAVHLALLAAGLVLLPIVPSATWKPEAAGDPTWLILGALATSVGLPYFALSATSPLLQAWLSTTRPGASPYRLYAVSCAGSLLALATYPLAFEPLLRLRMQAETWSALFVAFAFLCCVCAVGLWRSKQRAAPAEEQRRERGTGNGERENLCGASPGGSFRFPVPCSRFPPFFTWAGAPAAAPPRPGPVARALWILLAACGSALLLAVTNQMCSDVGVVPLLWVLPLALYLASFILCFQGERTYWRPLFWPLLALAGAAILWLLSENVHVSIVVQIAGYSLGLFVCCMVCHGELARLKPDPRYLTGYYLAIAAGGAVGGALVALVAPVVFSAYFELHLALGACFVLAGVAFWREAIVDRRWQQWWSFPLLGIASAAVPMAACVALAMEAQEELRHCLSSSRNFYGVLQVTEYNKEDPDNLYYVLCHGRIMHGSQYAAAPRRYRPTTYYGEKSGVGLAVLHRCPRPGRAKVGVVGLGTGTIAVHGRPGDTYRFYEINPAVEQLARTQFTYLSDSRARCEVVMGDARLSLEREPPQAYDVLALDAFSSDAIPVHLLTEEAFAIYLRHLKPEGVLAVHISNRFLDLEPVVLGLADRLNLGAAVISVSEDEEYDEEGEVVDQGLCSSTWVLVTRDKEFLDREPIRAAATPPAETSSARIVWTDDYSNLLRILTYDWPAAD